MDAKTLIRLFAEAELPRPSIDAVVRHLDPAGETSAAFWATLRADPDLSSHDIEELRFVALLGELTDAHRPLVGTLLSRRRSGALKHAADLFAIDWPALLGESVDGVTIGAPPQVPGDSAAQRSENFARQLSDRLPKLFATGAVVHALRQDPQPPTPEIARFFTDNPDFDLRGAGVDAYLKDHPAALQTIDSGQRNAVLTRLYALQRLFWLTDQLPNQAQTIANLYAAGLDSAHEIAALGEKTFCQRLPAQAHLAIVHARAAQHTATLLALNAKFSRQYDALGVAAIDRPSAPEHPPATLRLHDFGSDVQAAVQGELRDGADVPDWQRMFGAIDDGTFDPGRSVLGPSAYLVDLLSLLDNLKLKPVRETTRQPASALSILRERRPDIEDIELCQDNAEIALPYIDLVLEVLECALFPMHFALTDPDRARAAIAALQCKNIDDSLRLTFAVNDRPLGEQARVEADRDAPDTRWRIIDAPHSYHLENVYDGGDQIRISVQPARRRTTGTPDELRAMPQHVDLQAYAALSARRYPWALPFDLCSEEVRAWLAQMGVPRYRLIELLHSGEDHQALIAAEFFALCPHEKPLLCPTDDAPWTRWGFAHERDESGENWCMRLAAPAEFLARSGLAPEHLDELLTARYISQHPQPAQASSLQRLHDADPGLYDRVHRFLRLQRKTGWTIAEFDKVLDALGNPPKFDDAMLVSAYRIRRLQDAFKRPLDEVLSWLGDIDTTPASAGASSMARALGLSLDDFSTLRELTAPPPGVAHDVPPGEERLAFIATLRRLQGCGFSVADLDYLLRHRRTARSAIAPGSELVRRVLASITASLRDIGDANRLSDNADEQYASDLLRAKLRQLNGDDAAIGALLATLNEREAHRAEIGKALHELAAKGRLLEISGERLAACAKEMETLTEPHARILQVLGAVLPCVHERDAVIAITHHIGEALGLGADVAARLLGARRSAAGKHSTGTAPHGELDAFLGLQPDPATKAPSDEASARAITAFYRLHTLAVLIARLHLSGDEVDWLFDDQGCAVILDADHAPAPAFARLAALVELSAVRDQIGSHAAHLLRRMAHAPVDRRKPYYGELSDALACRIQDAEYLATQLPSAPLTAASISRFGASLAALKALGVSAAKAARWTSAELTANDVKAVRDAARARIDEHRWTEVAVPLRDALREKQRVALVACLLAQNGLTDSHALYQHFLLDVDMGPDTLTSRTRLAISSLQLYVQRLLMNLEDWRIDEHAAEDCRRQWQSLKNYRVWEANRKVFIYPENWIEPELRKDKTALFRALESDLQQGDLTSAAAERAVRGYLEGLEQIGKLEICALTADPDPDSTVLHVFGRTRSVPKTYYYRRRERGLWGSWERLEFGVDSDHLIPLVFDHGLYLFWPEFTEQTMSELRDGKGTRFTIGKADIVQSWDYWDVRLAFSQYRPGGWSPRKLLDGCLSIDRPAEPLDATKKPPPLDKDERRPRSERSAFSFAAEVADAAVLIGCLRREKGGEPHTYTDQGSWRFTTDAYVEVFAPTGKSTTPRWPFGEAWQRSAMAFVPDDAETTLRVDGRTLLPSLPHRADSDAKTRASAGAPGVRLLLAQQCPRYWDGQLVKDAFVFVYQDNDRCLLIGTRQPTHASTEAPAFSAENLYHPAAGDFMRRLNRDGLPALWHPSEQQKNRESLLFRLHGFEQPFFAAQDSKAIERIFLREHRAALDSRGLKPPGTGEAITISPECGGARWLIDFGNSFSCRVNADADGELLVDQDAVQQYGKPEAAVLRLPAGDVDFAANGAYAQYNWELFLHVPLLLADRLGRNQRFEEAQNWFHHIFDPTAVSDDTTPQRYWKVRAFAEAARHAPPRPGGAAKPADDAADAEQLHAQFVAQVDNWRAAPFDPHAVARLRVGAYQKTVVMKYIDNLIAWGDQLFRTDTIESINEATQLYVLAAEILGRRPPNIALPQSGATDGPSFRELMDGENHYSDLWTTLENRLTPSWMIADPARKSGGTELPAASLRNYFCVPRNDKLLAYWDLVGDRLFKIRHGQNIEGTQRALALYEPPIDPGLLVRAAAAGVDLASVLRDISAPLPYHRFKVMLGKAIAFCSDVRDLGTAFLAALERKDAQDLERLRLRQVSFDLQRQIGDKTIEEAQQCVADFEQARQTKEDEKKSISENIDLLKVAIAGGGGALPLGKAIWKMKLGDAITARWDKTDRAKAGRKDRLKEFDDKITPERRATDSRLSDVSGAAGASAGSKEAALLVSQTTYMSAAATGTLPTMITGAAGVASPVALVMTGGQQMAESSKTWGKVAEIGGLLWEAAKSAIDAYNEISRQKKDAEDHKTRVEGEIKGIEKRIAAANLGVELAQLRKKQIDKAAADAEQIEIFLSGRFTGPELYDWRVAQLSTLYFQTYQLAYDLAKRAEKAMHHELGTFADAGTPYIGFGYWDSRKKGLLAAEQLLFDLRRMEKAYLDQDRRGYEITRHVALHTLTEYRNPIVFADGIRKGELRFRLPEALFDCDYPGHYLRRIRSVRVSLDFANRERPANVCCTLTLTASSVRISPSSSADYVRTQPGADERFRDATGSVQAIATSSGVDDAGLFVVDFDDERYLPFEGAGAISAWKIELPVDSHPELLDLADIVLHLSYTARDGGSALKKAAAAAAKTS